MKHLLLLIPIFFCLSSFACDRDSVPDKKDTVRLPPVIITQQADTIALTVWVVTKKTHVPALAYLISSGYKDQAGSWVKPPSYQLLDEKWFPFKAKIILPKN